MRSALKVDRLGQLTMRLGPVAAQALHLQKRLLGSVRKIRSAIGLLGFVVLAIGLVIALSCSLWAIKAGVPQPLAIMAGYCTVIVTACFCSMRAALARSDTQTSTRKSRQPTYAAWRLVATLRVSDAARLWSNIEPGCPASQESIAWAQAMLDAIKRGVLPVHARKEASRSIDQERENPGWHTEIPREAVRTWAHSHGHAPSFLE
jgi:hypothetical protein